MNLVELMRAYSRGGCSTHPDFMCEHMDSCDECLNGLEKRYNKSIIDKECDLCIYSDTKKSKADATSIIQQIDNVKSLIYDLVILLDDLIEQRKQLLEDK